MVDVFVWDIMWLVTAITATVIGVKVWNQANSDYLATKFEYEVKKDPTKNGRYLKDAYETMWQERQRCYKYILAAVAVMLRFVVDDTNYRGLIASVTITTFLILSVRAGSRNLSHRDYQKREHYARQVGAIRTRGCDGECDAPAPTS